MFKNKLIEWFQRYFVAETVAIISSMVGGWIVYLLFQERIFTAVASTWIENLVYYGIITFKDFKSIKKKNLISFFKLVRNMVLEFGPGEYLDSFVIRPFTNWYFPRLIGNIPIGLLIGQLVANVSFYAPTILAYEIRKKFFKD